MPNLAILIARASLDLTPASLRRRRLSDDALVVVLAPAQAGAAGVTAAAGMGVALALGLASGVGVGATLYLLKFQ